MGKITPHPYIDIENALRELTGAPEILTFPTITHIHMSVIPFLAGQGTVFLDSRAHKTIYDGCKVAEGQGATLIRFPHNDADALEHLVRTSAQPPTLICMDGVNSMTGNIPDLSRFAKLAKEWNSILYVDDAHGFGLIGEEPGHDMPWGKRGNGIVRYCGLSYDHIVLVAGLSKSYSSLLAFMGLPSLLKERVKVAAAPYLYSGPSPVASLATTLSGLRVNARTGETLRRNLYDLCVQLQDGLKQLNIYTLNQSTLPIFEIPLKDTSKIDALGTFLFDNAIYVTLALYPLVPKKEVGIRIQLTAANTSEEVTTLLNVLDKSRQHFQFYPAASDLLAPPEAQ
ncbi:aminotransferase class I/II-fold pyridoxal phosphate-dependent enzyme [Pectobacterium polaris]|uniref:aminotransferase class I/II-fold pyridoxal phosphate-dependent enzyme n=1 Tax=Pectobacterium polaris TaxID=2042057 RepID=UPI001583992B|nr:aminotransferase class I/II-fold pyridoxal phosphate-dependent enzyme [Pectobacterium polaris]